MSAPESKLHERHLAAARAQLGEGAFAAAWAEGRGLTAERAIAELARAVPAERPAPAAEAAPQRYPAGLSEREVEVLRLVAKGLTNAQIADRLVLSPLTVNAHLRSIFSKIEVSSRASATRFAVEHHLV
jgi:DNA-binding NarL/FixJ family response regulator